MEDVSILGGRFTSTAPLEKNQNVRVQFRIDSGELLELGARVIWAEKRSSNSEYGVSFEHPTAVQLKSLEQWMARHPEAVHKQGKAVCPTCLRPWPAN